MAERQEDPRIEQLYKEGRTVYSISRLDTIDRCERDAYYTYYLGQRGLDSIYTGAGGKTHDILQGIMEGNNTPADLLPSINEELKELEMLGLCFPKDKNGNDTIRNKWVSNMTHFCKTFVPMQGNFKAEELLILRLGETRAIRGYADYLRFNEDGTVSIGDYKTSSMYTKDNFQEHGRQLIVYWLALEQMGYKVRDAHWYFLKYVTIEYDAPARRGSKTIKHYSKNVERSKIGDTIAGIAGDKMNAAGYDALDTDTAIYNLRTYNDVNQLPPEIASQFKVQPCLVYWPLSEENKQECLEFIDRVATRFEALVAASDAQGESVKPWDAIEINKDTSFFCNNLCSHRDVCQQLRDYKNRLDFMNKSDDELF